MNSIQPVRCARTILSSIILAILLSGVAAPTARAQETPSHPIDDMMGRCTEQNPSTHGMIACIREAEQRWDAELNRSYTKLVLLTTPDQKAALKLSQRQWIGFRDAELANLDSLYAGAQGTQYLVELTYDRKELTKRRALDLEELVEMYLASH